MLPINLPIPLLLAILILLSGCGKKDNRPAKEVAAPTAGQYLSWSIKMADSELERRENSLLYGGSNPKAKWDYASGLFLKSLLDLWKVTGDSKYLDYARQVIDSFIEQDGRIKTYKMSDYNLDNINPGKVLLDLYQITSHEKYKRSADILFEQLQNQPRTSEGGFWHKQRYPWQMWLDGIYMSAPFYAQYGLLFQRPNVYEDVVKQIKLIDMHTRDARSGLRYHGWDESNEQAWADPVTGCSPHFWGRALGWYSMALVDVLDFIPADYPSRGQLLYILNDLLKAISKYQDDTGLWYQILDRGEQSGNYLETSASAMFVYAIAKALNQEYIDPSYREVAVKGYNGLLKEMISIEENNRLSLKGICSVAGLGGDPYRDGSFDYYISEPVVANDLKGVAPFIMAGLQLHLANSQASD